MMTSRRAALVSLAAVLLATLALSPSIATAKDKPEPLGVPVNCVQLATDPAVGLAGNPVIKAATSTLIPASGVNKAHCRVDVLYGTSPEQNINIRAGLPLNSLDGGTGGIQGAWNGRTQGVGGGGCAGNVNVTAPVNAGYVGSGTDTGHAGGNCEPGVNEDGTYNLQFIDDFIRNAIKQQVVLSKVIARAYYGIAPAYNYWNGCSTGGRAGVSARAGAGGGARRHPRQRARDLLDSLSDRPDVGADRDEGSARRGDFGGEAQPGDRVRRRRVRCG